MAAPWEADDLATALLMVRSHQNLTGTPPRPKAAALAEAKRWLRDLTAEEVERLENRLTTAPATAGVIPTPARAVRDGVRPFQDPRYWAPFVLIGLGE